jgi:tetratricopeptide (TPR) repeat protein
MHSSVWKQTKLAYQMIPAASPPEHASADALVDHGRRLMNKGRNADAVQWFSRALHQDPRLERGYVNRSVAWMRLNRLDQALADLDAALRINPRTHAARYNRAIVHRRRGDLRAALADLDRVIAAGKYGAKALRNRARVRRRIGNLRAAEADLRKALSLEPDHVASATTLADLLMDRGQVQQALSLLNQVLKRQPRYRSALAHRAGLYRCLGRLGDSLADADRLIAIDPQRPYGYLQRGWVRLARGAVASARADYGRAVSLAGDHPQPWVKRALELHATQGHWRAAESDLREALKRAERTGGRLVCGYAIYLAAVLVRRARLAKARAVLEPRARYGDRCRKFVRYLRGVVDPDTLRQALLPNAFRPHAVQYFQGLRAELEGKPARALTHYRRVPSQSCVKQYLPLLAGTAVKALSDE